VAQEHCPHPGLALGRRCGLEDATDRLAVGKHVVVVVPPLAGRENVAIEYRWAEGEYDRLQTLALELVRRQVSVIVTGGNAATFAVKAATTTIPIVFILVEDPVQLGLVASLPRPGGNATGVNLVSGELTAKQLELLHELMPAAARVAVLVNPADATATETTLRDLETAAPAIGLKMHVFKATTSQEIHAAFVAMVRERSEALSFAASRFSSAAECNLLRSRRVMRFR
jgi:ABC-type uncharacterized transport system substrate-binding protein